VEEYEDVEGAPHPAYSATMTDDTAYYHQNHIKWKITVYADTIEQLRVRVERAENELLKTRQRPED